MNIIQNTHPPTTTRRDNMSKRPINFMTTSPPSKVQHIVPITPHSNEKAQFDRPYLYRSRCDDDDDNDDDSDEDDTIDGNDDDDNGYNDDDDEEDKNNSNNIHHHIIQTILGPICTKCNTKIVLRDNLLFTASRNTIRKHLTTNKCYQGNISNIGLRSLERSLRISIIGLYESMNLNPTIAKTLVHAAFPSLTTMPYIKSPYCHKCGLFGSTYVVKRHISSASSKCTLNDYRDDGIIVSNQHSFSVPTALLSQIAEATFRLPFCTDTIPIYNVAFTPTSQSQSQETVSTITSPSGTTSAQTTSFLPSKQELQVVCSTNSPFSDVTLNHSFALSELHDTFGDESEARAATSYLTSYVYLISQDSPGGLKRALTGYATMSKSPHAHLDFNFQLFLEAGKQWINTQSANMDVCMVPVHLRNQIYLVGNSSIAAEEDYQKGCTFVWTNDVPSLVAAFVSLATFAFAFKCQSLLPYLKAVQDLFDMIMSDHASEMSADELEELAATKIVNTSIISGFLTDILLETPCFPNGPVFLYHYLASITIKATSGSIIRLRNPNEISKKANSLLRLLRHAWCSLYMTKSKLSLYHQRTHDDLITWAKATIARVQCSSAIGHICRTIRTAREVDNKTYHSVYKAFNDSTGDIIVDGHEISRSTWSVAIPTACQEWDKFLFSLFPDPHHHHHYRCITSSILNTTSFSQEMIQQYISVTPLTCHLFPYPNSNHPSHGKF